MQISTKSIQKKPNPKDGIRICIMRRIKPEFVFDIWIPTLAPSTKLLKTYHEKKIDWKEYEERFAKEVLDKRTTYLQILLDICKRTKVTLLCWEKTPETCHRRLVIERLKSIEPNLDMKLA